TGRGEPRGAGAPARAPGSGGPSAPHPTGGGVALTEARYSSARRLRNASEKTVACVPGAFFTPANIARPATIRTEVTSLPRPVGPAGRLTRRRTSPPGPTMTARS